MQCSCCLTLYDEDYGDPPNKVAAGTKFENLPADYECPTCGATLQEFLRAEKSRFHH
ncbi:MAG: rubredoxin [Puia sp.]|nr:rubredoxin [Puia sp.]